MYTRNKKNRKKGGALTEALVYITISAVLMATIFVGGTFALRTARKLTVQSAMRNARTNILQLVNESELYNLSGADATAKTTNINNLVNEFFEAEMSCSLEAKTGDGFETAASKSYAYAGTCIKKDPWGESYIVAINNLGKGEVVIAFVSAGSDRESTITTDGKIGADDTGLLVHVHDSNALYYEFEGSTTTTTDGEATDGKIFVNLKDCKLQKGNATTGTYIDMATSKWKSIA